ncbi:hypothetical protein JCM8547_002542 [Rhodosporidiobolus lusitaniae]
MSLTTDSSKLFQTDEQQRRAAIREAKAEALATRGAPLKLGSKPLQVVVREGRKDGEEAEAWVAESGFIVRRVGLESGKTKQLYKGHSGPVTSIDFYKTPGGREVMISGSWDKSFKIWDVQTKQCISTTVGHLDFVKTVHVIPALHILLTGSSDKDLRVWDLSSLDTLFSSSSALSPASSSTPERPHEGAAPPPATPLNPLPCLLALKAHTRPLECLASYPLYAPLPSGTNEDDVDLSDRERTGHSGVVSADSMGAVKVWELWREDGKVEGELRCEVRDHEMGIWDLKVGPEGELWTASADSSLLLSRLSLSTPSTPPTPLLRIPHPSQVRSFLSLPLTPLSLSLPPPSYVLTGASDELLRVFDLADPSGAMDSDEERERKREWTGLPLPEGAELEGCVNEIEGHTHDVVALGAYTVKNAEKGGRREVWIVSGSLDGTLRRWKFEEELKMRGRFERVEIVEIKEDEEGKESLLTEEEERELEELMADD